MKIFNGTHKGFSVSPVLMILLLIPALFILASCGDASAESKPALKEVEKPAEEIRDNSMEFSGNVAQFTCLECHPRALEGKSDVDFNKVRAAGMSRGKNMDVRKEKQKAKAPQE